MKPHITSPDLNWKIYSDDHSSLSSTTAVQILITSHEACCNTKYWAWDVKVLQYIQPKLVFGSRNKEREEKVSSIEPQLYYAPFKNVPRKLTHFFEGESTAVCCKQNVKMTKVKCTISWL